MIVSISTLHYSSDIRITRRILRLLSDNFTKPHLLIARAADVTSCNNINITPVRGSSNLVIRLLSLALILYKNRCLIVGSVLILNDPELLLLRPFLMCLRPKLLIYDSHEDPLLSTINALDFSIRLILHFILKIASYPFLIVLTAGIAVISPTSLILSRFLLASNKFLMPNFPSLYELNFISQVTPALPMPTTDTPIQIITIGNLSANRASIEILGSIRYLPSHFSLVIAGKIDLYTERFIQSIESQVRDRISVVGDLSLEELYLLLNASHLGLCLYRPIASYSNSLPLKLSDYALTRKPVVCSDFVFWETVYQISSFCTVVNQLSSRNIADKIQELIADYDYSIHRANQFYDYFVKTLVLDNFVSELSSYIDD